MRTEAFAILRANYNVIHLQGRTEKNNGNKEER
jgi:hypothetical protein